MSGRARRRCEASCARWVGARVSGGDSYRMVQHARKDGKSQVDYVLETIQGLPLPDDHYVWQTYRHFLVQTGTNALRAVRKFYRA